MKNISVIGAGTMGNGIAHVFAQHNFQVNLVDIDFNQLQKGMKTIEKNIDRQIAKNIMKPEDKILVLDRIRQQTNLAAGVADADLIVEAATENAVLKSTIFAQLDEAAPPSCILATNTSSISITKLAAATRRPEMVIGMHFMNPVPVMQLVEIINGYATKSEVTSKIFSLTKELGKTPCIVNDYPGFIANRILMPMINEAIYSVFEGVAGVSEVDTVMKLGMSHPMGPLQLADFIGLDVCHAILSVLYEGFKNPKYAPCPLLTNMVSAGFLGIKSGEGFYNYAGSVKDPTISSRFTR